MVALQFMRRRGVAARKLGNPVAKKL